MADTKTPPASTATRDVLYALTVFERTVRENEMAGSRDPEEAEEIRTRYRKVKRLLREMIRVLGGESDG